ncbi:MAG: GNAT family N-acetyltransferase [Bacteroidota bacterium]
METKLALVKVMMNIEIRRVLSDEVDRLRHVAISTFVDTYGALNSEENMHKYLQTELSVKKLQTDLFDHEVHFYFAFLNQEIIGYLRLNLGKAQTEFRENNTIEIERIYVLRTYQGMRVGWQLCDLVCDLARVQGMEFIWLGVWEKNHSAIRFYEKYGFVTFSKHVFKLGDEDQTDLLMKLMI